MLANRALEYFAPVAKDRLTLWKIEFFLSLSWKSRTGTLPKSTDEASNAFRSASDGKMIDFILDAGKGAGISKICSVPTNCSGK